MSRIRAPRRFRQMLPMAAWLLGIVASSLSSAAVPDRLQDFLELNCVSCHEGEFGEGGFDATAVSGELQEDSTRDRWIRIFDRVQAGAMPPAEAGGLPAAETTPFLSEL